MLLEVEYVLDIGTLVSIFKIKKHLFADILDFGSWIGDEAEDQVSRL